MRVLEFLHFLREHHLKQLSKFASRFCWEAARV